MAKVIQSKRYNHRNLDQQKYHPNFRDIQKQEIKSNWGTIWSLFHDKLVIAPIPIFYSKVNENESLSKKRAACKAFSVYRDEA